MEDLTLNSEEMKLSTISSLIAQIHTEATNFLDSQLKTEGMTQISTSHGFILFTLSQNKNETDVNTCNDCSKSSFEDNFEVRKQ